MDLIQEVSGNSPFWNEISENPPDQEKKWEDMTRVERDEFLLQYDEMQAKKMGYIWKEYCHWRDFLHHGICHVFHRTSNCVTPALYLWNNVHVFLQNRHSSRR